MVSDDFVVDYSGTGDNLQDGLGMGRGSEQARSSGGRGRGGGRGGGRGEISSDSNGSLPSPPYVPIAERVGQERDRSASSRRRGQNGRGEESDNRGGVDLRLTNGEGIDIVGRGRSVGRVRRPGQVGGGGSTRERWNVDMAVFGGLGEDDDIDGEHERERIRENVRRGQRQSRGAVVRGRLGAGIAGRGVDISEENQQDNIDDNVDEAPAPINRDIEEGADPNDLDGQNNRTQPGIIIHIEIMFGNM